MPRDIRKAKLLGNHQKSWLWGRHAVLETLRAGKWLPAELRLSESLDSSLRAEIESLAADGEISIQIETDTRLTQLCKADDHQGCLARMPEFPYADANALIESAPATPAFVILDGVQDPFNLGAILRSAAAFGIDGVFLAAAGQVGVTSRVARSSAGAVNQLPIARVERVDSLIAELRSRDVRVFATTPSAGLSIDEAPLNAAVAVLIGNEARGISASTRELCDAEFAIPQTGAIDSLNAAVAAGVVFYEIARQRQRTQGFPKRDLRFTAHGK